MTEKNADVEWLRERWDQWEVVDPERAQRLLAHIDELEAEVRRLKTLVQLRNRTEPEHRPTIHEIAAQMMAAMIAGNTRRDQDSSDGWNTIFARHAELAYAAAEALVAEGRRRDGS